MLSTLRNAQAPVPWEFSGATYSGNSEKGHSHVDYHLSLDMAKELSMPEHKALERLDRKKGIATVDTLGDEQKATVINESGSPQLSTNRLGHTDALQGGPASGHPYGERRSAKDDRVEKTGIPAIPERGG